ncbi:hypothetical protein [Serratia fonticola]|uniref:hypothetical protein n=1 Tax=Serratia fonticola TaxID=47917 RepID=UPI0004670E7E|nr:hypothetical protein [Serratia fonticola]
MSNYTNDEDGVCRFIQDKAFQAWEVNGSPYLLSNAVTDFREYGDMKSVIGARSLKSWVSNKEDLLNVKVLTHPVAKARIVVVPKDSNFSFESATKTPSANGKKELTNREITILFLEAIGSLPQHDLEEINIPVRIIAKLMR